MKLRSALAALAVSVSLVVPGCVAPAAAQGGPFCAPVKKVFSHLEKMGEEFSSGGQVDDNRIVVVMATPDGSSWSMVSIDTNGVACLIAAGSNWDDGKPKGQEV